MWVFTVCAAVCQLRTRLTLGGNSIGNALLNPSHLKRCPDPATNKVGVVIWFDDFVVHATAFIMSTRLVALQRRHT